MSVYVCVESTLKLSVGDFDSSLQEEKVSPKSRREAMPNESLLSTVNKDKEKGNADFYVHCVLGFQQDDQL